jgi:hypothetical protein
MSLTITGILTIILSQVLEATVAIALASDIVLVIGVIVTWWGRYRIGDLNITGLRK